VHTVKGLVIHDSQWHEVVCTMQYSSTAMSGVELVTIQPTDVAYTTSCSNPNQPCVATIAVYGFSSAGYTITASTGATTLMDGEVTYGEGQVSF
jgi:hypothetical protein